MRKYPKSSWLATSVTLNSSASECHNFTSSTLSNLRPSSISYIPNSPLVTTSRGKKARSFSWSTLYTRSSTRFL
uniref:Putative secreted protein n=1 Tax=Ixodes ricinus TaxID=34613 RepID=A0A6B0TSZ7_IXORI